MSHSKGMRGLPRLLPALRVHSGSRTECFRQFSTPEAEQPLQHWLDRYPAQLEQLHHSLEPYFLQAVELEQQLLSRLFPGARQWLEGKNRRWWLKGVQARCRYADGHPAADLKILPWC